MYRRAQDAHGNSWGAPVLLDDTSWIDECTSLKIVNGYPAIAYYDNSNGDLKYIRADDAEGNTWQVPTIVESEGDIGSYASMAIVDGNPAILYFDTTNVDLKYIRANDASGDSWETPVIVEDDYGKGFPNYALLVVVNGAPATAFYDRSTYRLGYKRALDSHGDAWGSLITIDDLNLTGGGISLAVVEGYPAIAYQAYEDEAYSVKFVRATDADGLTWGNPYIFDNVPDCTYGPSLAVAGGKPYIAYPDWDAQTLEVRCALDALGESWSQPVSFSLSRQISWYPSLAEVAGRPAIVHYGSNTYCPLMFTYLY
jgi:hypothetical protein